MMWGLVLAFGAMYLFRRPPLEGLFDWWKLFFVLPVSILFGLAASKIQSAFNQIAIMLAAVVLNWRLNGRAMGGIFIIVAVLLVVRLYYRKRVSTGRKFRHRLHFYIPVSIALITLVVFPLFSSLAMKGYFGPVEGDRTTSQVEAGQQYIGRGILGRFFGLLIGGRNEIIV